MSKRIAQTLVLIIFMLLFTAPALADAVKREFSDLPGTHWAAGMIYNLVGRNWLSGYPDNTFRPDQKVTRAELAAMIAGAAGKNPPPPQSPALSDVSGDKWYFSPVEASKAFFSKDPSLGTGLFRPEDPATRQEAVSAIAMAGGLPDADPGRLQTLFSDYRSILPEYRGIISSAVNKGLVRGYPDGTFGPGGPLTRAEAAVLIDTAFLKEEVPGPDQDIEKILSAVPVKAFSKTPEEFRPVAEKLEGLGNLDGVSLIFTIDEIALKGVENERIIIVFARVDPFKYFTFSDVIFKTNPDLVKAHAEKMASEGSKAVPGKTVAAVIGYSNLTFYPTTPQTFGEEYTGYSSEEGGWRVKRFYSAALALDGSVSDSWVEKTKDGNP
ncbi:MAG: S-layer homology domain-containing protein [Firmicutes bacterium]|nr:S-layer homology domain-containing protein [Bacillota bacterium]MCL5058596.1 S-layer homology domain-containing protein [Actinomycetota bacterium]